jgi:hypothetical protein
MANSVDFKTHFEDFVNATEEERARAELRRDYRDLKQWTEEQVAKLAARDQAPIVFDQFSKKVDGIVGLEVQRRTDPKALPVHPKHDKAADVITDALRYVEGRTSFDETATEVFEDKIVEGYGGAITEVEKKGDEYIISVNRIPWDRLYFDHHSRNKDFSDSSYFGITLWMDADDAVKLNPSKKSEIENLFTEANYEDETFEDRPKDWIDVNRRRVRVNQEYYLYKQVWHEVFYSGDVIIIEPKKSPYLDEDGDPMCPIELESDFIDRDNNRWGYMQRLIDVQDEINHRRSKALFMLSSKTITAEKGAFEGMTREQVLNEYRKGMSYIEKRPQSEVVIDNQQDMGQSQLGFYQDAQNAMDSVGINPELTGSTQNAISGRAFIARQQGGMVELAKVFSIHSNWKRRIYTQIWLRMRQFWPKEKWIRVSDDENAMRFVGLNVPITRAEKTMEDQSGRTIEDIRSQAGSDIVDEFIQLAVSQNPLMGEVVETRNDVKRLEMDIILEEVPDTAIIQQEQFDTLANLAAVRGDPQMFEALLMLSTIKGKKDVLDKFKPDEKSQQAQAEAQNQVIQIETAERVASIENKQADTKKKQAETAETISNIPLNEARTKDEMASAVERVGRASVIGLQ